MTRSWHGYTFCVTGFCQGNPQYPSISHRVSNAKLWYSLFDVHPSKLFNKQSSWQWFEKPRGSCDVIVMTAIPYSVLLLVCPHLNSVANGVANCQVALSQVVYSGLSGNQNGIRAHGLCLNPTRPMKTVKQGRTQKHRPKLLIVCMVNCFEEISSCIYILYHSFTVKWQG